MRGNTALANVLKMEGTEYLFCYPANPLIEAAAIAGIRPIMSRTERTTVNMADGFTRVSNGRRTGVVVTQSGRASKTPTVAWPTHSPSQCLFLSSLADRRGTGWPNFLISPPWRPTAACSSGERRRTRQRVFLR